MKKKILLPTDFSKNAWNALRYASELYKNEDVDFYLLNAYLVQNYSIYNMMIPMLRERYNNEAKLKSKLELKKLLKRIKILNSPNNLKYYTKSVLNSPIEAVKTFVEDKDIDLVIVGNRGETDANDDVIESSSINFMEKVRNCPVLMIPAKTSFKEPNEIVFPTSFKTHFKHRELIHLYEIAKITNAPIRVFHVGKKEELTKEQKEKKQLLEECFDGLIYTYHFMEYEDVQTGLKNFTQSRNSDMISFINKKHAFFGTLFSRPMVKVLGDKANVPILTLHDLQN